MLDPLSNPSYLLPPLVVALVAFMLIALLWRKSRRDHSSVLFSGVLLSLGTTSILLFFMRSAPDNYLAIPWERAVVAATLAQFVLYYHFTAVYSNSVRRRTILGLYCLFVTYVVLANTTDLVIEGVRSEDYGYAPIIGPLTSLGFLCMLILLIGGAFNLYKRYKVLFSYDERNRLLYLFLAILFPLIGIGFDAFSDLPPLGNWSNLIFCIICTVAMLRYHLLDIRLIIRKGLIYLLISIIIALPYVVALLTVNRILKTTIEPWWVSGSIILILAIALRPMHSWGQRLVDRLFYRDSYDYLIALEQLSWHTQSIESTNEIGSTIVKLLRKALRASSVALLLPRHNNRGLAIASYDRLDNPPTGLIVRGESPLKNWFGHHRRILDAKEFAVFPELQSISRAELQKLEQLRAEIYVPIQTHQNYLSGMLVLGKKLSEVEYSTEEKRFLSTLAGQMATTLENIRLYQDVSQARQNLQSWLGSIADAVMIVDKDYRIQFMNQTAIEKFGNMVHQKCWNVIGRNAVCATCPLANSLKHSDENTVHYNINITDREYDVIAALLLNPDGSPNVVEVLRDVTKYRRMEEKERQLQDELSQTRQLASIGELASGVAHEINNPLTTVLVSSERLLRKVVDDKVKIEVERIHSEARRAAKVVENLLTFARRREARKELADINDIVQKALELRAYELKTSNIEIIVDLAPDLPRIMVDFHQLQQSFLNLLMNAEQSIVETNRRGKITVTSRRGKGHIRISFTDNGPGISGDHLNRIFDPFFTTRSDRDGTGLGLSVCHGIVTEHGGRIYAKSKPGKGATFFIELPLSQSE